MIFVICVLAGLVLVSTARDYVSRCLTIRRSVNDKAAPPGYVNLASSEAPEKGKNGEVRRGLSWSEGELQGGRALVEAF